MGKNRKKQTKKVGIGIAPVCIVALAAMVVLVCLFLPDEPKPEEPTGTGSVPTESTCASQPETKPQQEQSPISEQIVFPLRLSDGMLEIESMLQFDGLNPDCGNKDGKNIAAIMLKNLSEAYLCRADIQMKSSDGKLLRFVITDLPAGATVIAFSVDHLSSSIDTFYGDPVCDAVFDTNPPDWDAQVSVSVDGTCITLRNNTDQPIGKIVVYCHGTMGDQLFGGITYSYTVNNLIAGGTATLDAVECILGLAEVVRIVVNEP